MDKMCMDCEMHGSTCDVCNFYEIKQKLNRCPMCDAKPELSHHLWDGLSTYHVECECGARTLDTYSETEAMDHWNKKLIYIGDELYA